MAPYNGCYICAPLTATTVRGLLSQAREAKESGANCMEIRLDCIDNFQPDVDLPVLLNGRLLPTIVTYRPSWEGGSFHGDEDSRQATLRRAIELGADFVDIELQVAEAFIQSRPLRAAEGLKEPSSAPPPSTQIIVSNHNYETTPSVEELAELVGRIQATGADIVKFATTALDVLDAAKVLQLLTRVQIPIIALVMGPRGQISQLLAPKFGAFLTFGSLGPEYESAPGQPTISELSRVYNLGRVGRYTKVYGLVGNPVSQSKSPIVHNRILEERGIDGVYVPYLVDDVKSFLETFDTPDFAGFSVTLPHKEMAVSCCDEIDPLAKSIGAVNTIVRKPDGTRVGYNTDSHAAVSVIEDALRTLQDWGGHASSTRRKGSSPLEGRLVVVVGAGGAARALAFGARFQNALVVIANRNLERAKELAAAVNGHAIPLDSLGDPEVLHRIGALTGTDAKRLTPVLANTTSSGMQPNVDETPVPAEALSGYGVVFDAIYNPLETRLLREAKGRGCLTISGVEMFLRQAAEQFVLFTGQQAPVDLMREVVLGHL